MIGKKFYDKYRILVIIFTIFTFFVSIILPKSDGYHYVFLLPLVYFFLFILNSRLHKYSENYFGMFILNVLMFVRYVLAIILIVINKDFRNPPYTGVTPSPESCELAIIFMLIEMFSIFAIIFLFSDKIYNKKTSNLNIENNLNVKRKNSNSIYTIIILLSFILILLYPSSFFPNFDKFINSSYTNEEMLQTNGFIDILFYSVKLIIMGLIIEYSINKFNKKNSYKYVILSYITVIIYILLNVSSSRLNMILPFIFFLLITKNVFKKKGIVLFCVSSVILLLSIMTITVYKNSWLFSDDVKISDFSRVLSSQVQEYTSNIRPIAQGIESNEVYKKNISMNTFINDFFGSIPVINHFFDLSDRSNVYYNSYILHNNGKTTPLIMPLVTISSSFFTPVLCFIITDFCILIMMMIDKKQRYNCSNQYIYKYLNIYFVFIFSSCIYCNSQIIVGRLFTKALPVYIIYALNNKFKLVIRK